MSNALVPELMEVSGVPSAAGSWALYSSGHPMDPHERDWSRNKALSALSLQHALL